MRHIPTEPAEDVGFEPTAGISPRANLANWCNNPALPIFRWCQRQDLNLQASFYPRRRFSSGCVFHFRHSDKWAREEKYAQQRTGVPRTDSIITQKWWKGKDSNLRSPFRKHRFYRPPPLTAQPPFRWLQRRDLNPQPSAYEAGELPLLHSATDAMLRYRTESPKGSRICPDEYLP